MSVTVCNNLLLFNNRIVVPESLKKETLDKIHEGHQGIQRSRFRATSSVWWPGLSKEIVQTVQKCKICVRKNTPPKEPLIPSKLPDHPWQKIGSDLFELEGVTYLLVVDCFSKYPEVIRLNTTTYQAIISALKSIFSCYSIPEILISDNGPQYISSTQSSFTT